VTRIKNDEGERGTFIRTRINLIGLIEDSFETILHNSWKKSAGKAYNILFYQLTSKGDCKDPCFNHWTLFEKGGGEEKGG